MNPRLSHANIRVVDVQRSLEFYGALGLDVVGCAVLSPTYVIVYVGNPDQADVTLELVVNEGAGPEFDRTPGSGHVAFTVDDLEIALAQLADIGYSAEALPSHPADREDLPLVAFVRDPDGVRVELIERSFPTPRDDLPDWIVPPRRERSS